MVSCIAKINLENLTYTIPGGFNAAPYSIRLKLWETPRAQSFKGLWRWWLRALLSGALLGYREHSVGRVQEVTKKLLGSTAQASKFMLHVSVSIEGKAKPINAQAIKEWKKRGKELRIKSNELLRNLPSSPSIPPLPPRLFLLLEAKEDYKRLAEKISGYHPHDLKITIKLLERPFINTNFRERSIVLASLLLSLIFGGIGAITRRGFGSLLLTQIETSKELREYESIINDFMKANDPIKVRSLLYQLIKKSLSDTRELLGVKNAIDFNEVPNHPSLSEPGDPPGDVKPFNLSVFTLSILDVSNKEKEAFQIFGFKDYETMKLLTIIGYSTTKLFWKIIDHKVKKDREWKIPPGFSWQTWVMGLPREQKFDKQKLQVPIFQVDLYEDSDFVRRVYWDTLKTGYSLNNRDRRVSAISIKPIKRLDKNSWLIALYGFISKDWYNILHHYGVTPLPKRGISKYNVKRRKIIPSASVNKVFSEAWVKLKKIYGVE